MAWNVVKRKIGRAGPQGRRRAQQRAWDTRFGDGAWAVGYLVDGRFLTHEEAYDELYVGSYEAHFDKHPGDLLELVRTARRLRNPHAEATGAVDLQVPAIMTCLERRGLRLAGRDRVDIGTWQGRASHVLSVRLSPLSIKYCGDPRLTLEGFWQRRKCLAVWVADD